MRNFIVISFLIYSFVVEAVNLSCEEEEGFTVIITPPQDEDIYEVAVSFRVEGKATQAKGQLVGGNFIIQGQVPEVMLADLVFVKKRTKGFSLSFSKFILEPGTTKIDGSIRPTKFQGSPTQDDFTQFNSLSDNVAERIKDKEKELQEHEGLSSKITEKLVRELEVLRKEKELAWENYFESQANPLITAFHLEKYVTSQWINLEKAGRYYDELPPHIKKLNDVDNFQKRLKNSISFSVGSKLKHFSLPDENGEIVDTRDFLGKNVLIDFWASWCVPCRKENPKLVSLYGEYKEKNFDIIHVSFDQKPQAWLEAFAKDGLIWTNVVDKAGLNKSEIAKMFNIASLPRNLLVDKNGVIVARDIKGAKLRDLVSQLAEKK